MSIEFVTIILSAMTCLVGLGFIILDMEYAKRHDLPPRWIIDNIKSPKEITN